MDGLCKGKKDESGAQLSRKEAIQYNVKLDGKCMSLRT